MTKFLRVGNNQILNCVSTLITPNEIKKYQKYWNAHAMHRFESWYSLHCITHDAAFKSNGQCHDEKWEYSQNHNYSFSLSCEWPQVFKHCLVYTIHQFRIYVCECVCMTSILENNLFQSFTINKQRWILKWYNKYFKEYKFGPQ